MDNSIIAFNSLYSIYDKIAGAFAAPFLSRTVGTAQRSFNTTVSHADGYNAEDYDLYRVGEWDIDTGVIKALDKPEFICHAAVLDE